MTIHVSTRSLVGAARTGIGASVYSATAFLGAGDPGWSRGWIHAIVFVAASFLGSLALRLAEPDLMEARSRGIRADTKPFDRLFFRLFVPLSLIQPMLAGADAARFGWAPLPFWTVYPGIALFVAGSIVSTLAMAVNRHAESTVRIQGDRGHVVIDRGLYAVIRHPMYAGVLIGLPGGALMLGSAWTLVPAFLVAALFVARTAMEDRTLTRELIGYENYARTTRYRLIPGLW